MHQALTLVGDLKVSVVKRWTELSLALVLATLLLGLLWLTATGAGALGLMMGVVRFLMSA